MAQNKNQAEKFKQAARELGTNNDPDAFDRRMRRLKLAKPKRKPPAKKPSSKEKPQ